MRLELPKRTKNHFQLRTRWKSKCRRHFRLIGDWGFFKRNLSSARHWHKSNKSIATTQSFFETGTDVSAHLLGHETLFFNHSDWESGLDSFFWWEERKFKLERGKKIKTKQKMQEMMIGSVSGASTTILRLFLWPELRWLAASRWSAPFGRPSPRCRWSRPGDPLAARFPESEGWKKMFSID